MIFDGHIKQMGVDASTAFNETRGLHNIDSVNRKYRGGLNQTRDPFVALNTSFEDDNAKEALRNGNVSGVFGYEAIAPGTNTHLIVASGDSILAGRVYTQSISFRTLYRGIDPQWEHSFFVQEQNILVWQNGKDLPLAWDGYQDAMGPAKDFAEVQNAMPVGNIMVAANGRILVATEDNLVYASNHIYSKGQQTTNGVLDFTESTYPNSGDGFGAYSEIGPITAMVTLAAPGTINGDGETIVFGPKGAWSIATNKSRDEWTSSDIQRKVLVGRGTISPYSLVLANNDVWYRSSDRAIASFRTQLTDNAQRWTDQSLSSEVQPYLDYDDSINLRFSSGMFLNNRLIMSCAIKKEESGEYGIHRFANGMVALDFDPGSSTSRQDEGYSWDGLYTGPRPTGMAKLTPDLQERGFVVSYDTDGVNRVYELRREGDEDIVGDNRETKKIISFYTTHPIFENLDPLQQFRTFRLNGGRISYDHVHEASLAQEYRLDDSNCWRPLLQPVHLGCRECELDDCGKGKLGGDIYGTVSGKINSLSVPQDELPTGETIQIRTTIEGRASVRALRIEAQEQVIDNTATQLTEDEGFCPESCCNDLYKRFHYQF